MSSQSVNEAAWRLFPRRVAPPFVVSGNTEVDLAPYGHSIVSILSDGDVHLIATYDGSPPVATTADAPLPAGEVVEFKITAGVRLAILGTANVSLLPTS